MNGETTLGADDSTLFIHTIDRPALGVGFRLGSYSLIGLLGRGGFGEVWEAEDTRSGRRVALKVLTQVRVESPEVLDHFKREGQLAASINHPRSVFVFGAEQIQGHPVISMELLSGGTLQDQLRLRGRLPPRDAVDLILEIIEGLEAAQTAGIVHRDVKPSNCFLDEHGRAKIGDFGISKTLEAQDGFTSTGKFVGTPAYASPEQIRGRDVDYRSDIYSVGATLYCTLTGRPPFESQNAGELMARILSEEPVPFEKRQVRLPRRLDRIVLRCLAKDREKRYQSYAQLRADLLPFSSSYRLTTGNLAMRAAAFAVDETIITIGIATLIRALMPAWPAELAVSTLHFLYYGSFETLWGRTPGKYITRLRVVAASGTPMNLKQALIRSLVFGAIMLPAILLELKTGPAPLLSLATIGVYVATMRRENGFAGPHELLSATRVISFRAPEVVRAAFLQRDEWLQLRDDAQPRRFGPYRALRTLWQRESDALILAVDDLLKRNVWIHVVEGGRRQPRLHLIAVRPGKLRWLQGDPHEGAHWDAYEAPAGIALPEWVRLRRSIPWAESRTILLGLAEEIEARLQANAGETALTLTLQHLWVDPQGRAKVLEFPANTDAAPAETVTVDERNGKMFLHQVFRFLLTGKIVPIAGLGTIPPKAPVPEHARSLIARICSSESTFVSLGAIRSGLQEASNKAAEVRPVAKAGMLASVAALPLLFFLVYTLGPVVDSFRMPDWERELQRMSAYDVIMKELDLSQRVPALQPEIQAPCKVLAWVYREARSSPRGVVALSHLREFSRDKLATCAKRFPSLTETELAEARQLVDAHIAKHTVPGNTMLSARFTFALHRVFDAGAAVWALAAALALFCPPGPIARLFGFALQTTTGESAGPFRRVVRSLVAWLPFMLLFLFHGNSPWLWAFDAGVGILLLLGTIYSMIRPARGLPDLIAGTCLVPR
jgi:uncharacterized RDD family membrane protein YckC